MKDLTVSQVQRQNILNNNLALQEVEKNVGIQTNYYEDEMWLTKKQVQEFYEISDSTIERYIEKNSEELTKNGYKVLRGKAAVADDAADTSDDGGLDEELIDDLEIGCPDGFADAYFALAFSDACEHDVHDADTTDEQ